MAEGRILLGVIGRPHGVRGLVHVTSYTDEPAALCAYGALHDEAGRTVRLEWRGDAVAAISVDGLPVRDRDDAARLTNTRLYVQRSALPDAGPDEFYFADLVGLAVHGEAGPLGRVAAVHDYGAGASLEIARPDASPLLVPFTQAAVPEIDIASGVIRVVPPVERDERGGGAP